MRKIVFVFLLFMSFKESEAQDPSVGCWRNGVRCENLILNGGIVPAPRGMFWETSIKEGYEPLVGNWVYDTFLGEDRQGNSKSRSLLFEAEGRPEALNDEYLTAFHPKYKPGSYRFSFWVHEDSASLRTNNWLVSLKLRDWWDGAPGRWIKWGIMPKGAYHCYVVNKDIVRPSRVLSGSWYQVTWEFSVPLVESEWTMFGSPDPCNDSLGETIASYNREKIIPGGYALHVFPNGRERGMEAGHIQFDDFILERF